MSYAPPNLSLAQQLADAQWALHRLRLGRLSVEVEVQGRRVRYQRTDEDKLVSYIQSLNDQINGSKPRRGAIGFFL